MTRMRTDVPKQNNRHGSYDKTLKTKSGHGLIQMPRDRAGTFDPGHGATDPKEVAVVPTGDGRRFSINFRSCSPIELVYNQFFHARVRKNTKTTQPHFVNTVTCENQ